MNVYNKRHIYVVFLLLFPKLYCTELNSTFEYDLTIIGAVKWADGLGRIATGITDIFKDELSINHIPAGSGCDWTNIPDDIKTILLKPYTAPGKVSLLTAPLWYAHQSNYLAVPQESIIKIAYSMIECTAIPEQWASALRL